MCSFLPSRHTDDYQEAGTEEPEDGGDGEDDIAVGRSY